MPESHPQNTTWKVKSVSSLQDLPVEMLAENYLDEPQDTDLKEKS